MSTTHPQAEQSLSQKLAQAQQEADKWSQVAATPGLSPKAAAWAQGVARSSKAAAILYEKAMAFQQLQNSQSSQLDPSSKTRNPVSERLRPEFTLPSGDKLMSAAAAGIAIARAWEKAEAKPSSRMPSAAVLEAAQSSKPPATTAQQITARWDSAGNNDCLPDTMSLGANRRNEREDGSGIMPKLDTTVIVAACFLGLILFQLWPLVIFMFIVLAAANGIQILHRMWRR